MRQDHRTAAEAPKKNSIKEYNKDVLEKIFVVMKRDGMLVPFKRDRIIKAIEGAYRDTKLLRKEESLNKEQMSTIRDLADSVVGEAIHCVSQGKRLTVEGIQDIVEVKLIEAGCHDIARDYIRYREYHKTLREDSPRKLKVLRRDNKSLVRFNPMKISKAVEKGFRDTYEIKGSTPKDIVASINLITNKVIKEIIRICDGGDVLDLELIQDEIERQMMAEGFFDVAKDFIIYRSFRSASREEKKNKEKEKSKTLLKENEKGHTNAFFEARKLLDLLYKETMGATFFSSLKEERHSSYFKEYIHKAVKEELLNPFVLDFDLEILSRAMSLDRDEYFDCFSIKILYNDYLMRNGENRLETPQIFWMRIAMGLSLKEGELKNERAVEFYHLMSKLLFIPSESVLLYSAKALSQMHSSYLSTTKDDLVHIFKTISDDAKMARWACDIGNDWTNVRASGAYIKGTNGLSQGVLPFLKVANDMALAVDQGKKAKGAISAFLEIWHLDIENFLELRKGDGEEKNRTHDINIAVWVPDLFMKRLFSNEHWTLFSPDDVLDLHDLYGKSFDESYKRHEERARSGKIKLFKKVEAVQLWRKILAVLLETGYPRIAFKDPSNIRSMQDHAGVVHSSNTTAEVLLNTSEEEGAVCARGALNLSKFVSIDGIDRELLEKSVNSSIRILDNVIDVSYYPIEEARSASVKHRPMALGIMGFQDALHIQNISYASREAVEFADESMELLSYYAVRASVRLSLERGSYSTYKGSKWDRGILPIDSLEILSEERGEEYFQVNRDKRLNWEGIRDLLKKHGIRNSNILAIAPMEIPASIAGVSPSIQPTERLIKEVATDKVKLVVPNLRLMERLKECDLWDAEMLDNLRYFEGSLQEMDRVPQEIKEIFLLTFEIEPYWIIECASRNQKWIDMAQSLSFFIEEEKAKKLDEIYKIIWKKGIKTSSILLSSMIGRAGA